MLRSIDLNLARAAIGAALLALPGMAMADVLVVRAIGPSAAAYKPGRKLADTASIALKAGDQITLLDNKGTRTLKGPGSFTAAASGSTAAPTTLAGLASTAGGRRARTGAVRDVRAMAEAARPSIWMVDAGQSGTVCVPKADGVSVWRKDADAAGATTITGPGGQRGSIAWIKGQSMQPWPANLPVTPGASYTLKGAGAAAAGTAVKFALVDSPPGDLSALGSTLIASGCQAQLDMLIATANGG